MTFIGRAYWAPFAMAGWTITLVILYVLARRLPEIVTGRTSMRGSHFLYFGPLWWLVAVAPLTVTYVSPRHLYLAAIGVAVTFGIVFDLLWRRHSRYARCVSAVGVLALALAYGVLFSFEARAWISAGGVSKKVTRDLVEEARVATPGSLIVISAPPGVVPRTPYRGGADVLTPNIWAWALPYAIRPPFVAAEVTRHVFLIASRDTYCCPTLWEADTRRIISQWAQYSGPALLLHWDSNGNLVRLNDRDVSWLGDEERLVAVLTSWYRVHEQVRHIHVGSMPLRKVLQ